jgi:hypothetical protein
MDALGLKELKKEIQQLPNLQEVTHNFQSNWILPLRNNNAHLPFLKNLPKEIKAQLNDKLTNLDKSITQLKNGQHIHERFNAHSHDLIELKLTTLNGNKAKQKLLTNKLTNDEFSSIKHTVQHVKQFEQHAQILSEQYEEVNQLLEKQLSLEEMVYYMNLPHRKYLNTLIKTADNHQKIVRDLSRHFATIAEELQAHKSMHH